MKRNLPTLNDVAKRAKVSTATASRCLNEPHKVSAKTREHVLDVVKQLRYCPNFGAKAIAANRTNTYGVVIPTMENAIFARGIEAFQKTLNTHNATMLVASSSYDLKQEEKQIHTMIARGADGLLLIGTKRDSEIYSFLSDRNIPLVIAWACPRDKPLSYVGFDNRGSMKLLTQKAIEMGHRSFAYISAKTQMNDRAYERILGAKDALNEAGIDLNSMPIIETDQSIECGREAFCKLLSNNIRPTVVMGGNDVLAVGALQGARDAGLSVPDDISITGFDDIDLATVATPRLTTVHVPHRDMGRLAAETLFSMAKENSGPHHIQLDTYIVERETLKPPKS